MCRPHRCKRESPRKSIACRAPQRPAERRDSVKRGHLNRGPFLTFSMGFVAQMFFEFVRAEFTARRRSGIVCREIANSIATVDRGVSQKADIVDHQPSYKEGIYQRTTRFGMRG